MNKKIKIILIILLILTISSISYGIYYINDYYHADESIHSYLNGTTNVSVIKTSNGLFLNGTGEENAIIFYPGAKIEYTSYLPLLMNLSNKGIDCFIIQMPFNLAILGENSANEIINNNTYNYTHWYISGHSLGGAMASSYAHNNPDKIDGLILLAAYPTEKIENMTVISIYGSNDKILNKEKYENAKEYMPTNYTEYIIEGGNHAQFANYGNQNGDGIANITRDEQIKQTVIEILTLFHTIY